MTTKTTLKPCPFCGSEAVQEVYNEKGQRLEVIVRCSNCRAQGSFRPFVKDAVEAWNERR